MNDVNKIEITKLKDDIISLLNNVEKNNDIQNNINDNTEHFNDTVKVLNDVIVNTDELFKEKKQIEEKSKNKLFIVDINDIKKIIEEKETERDHEKDASIKDIEEQKNKFLSSVSKTIHNRVNKIEKFIADGLGKIVGAFKGIKDIVVGVGTFIIHPINTINKLFDNSGINNILGKNTKEDLNKVGIYRKNLNKNDVLNRSAIGVAIFWLAKKLGLATASDRGLSGILGAVTSGLKSLATRGLARLGGNLLLKAGKGILNFLLNPYVIGAIVIAVGSYLLYKWWRGRRDELIAKYATGKTTDEVLGRKSTEQEKERHKKLTDKYGAGAKTDKEAEEFIDQRSKDNGVLVGGRTALGTLGVGLGLHALYSLTSSTFLLGGALGPAAMALASNPVGWAIAAGLAIGGLTYGAYKLFSSREKTKKGSDQLIKEEDNKKNNNIENITQTKKNLERQKQNSLRQIEISSQRTADNTKPIEDIYKEVSGMNLDPNQIELPNMPAGGGGGPTGPGVTANYNNVSDLAFNKQGALNLLHSRGFSDEFINKHDLVNKLERMVNTYISKGVNPINALAHVIRETGLNSPLFLNDNNVAGMQLPKKKYWEEYGVLGKGKRFTKYRDVSGSAAQHADILIRNGMGGNLSTAEFAHLAVEKNYVVAEHGETKQQLEQDYNAPFSNIVSSIAGSGIIQSKKGGKITLSNTSSNTPAAAMTSSAIDNTKKTKQTKTKKVTSRQKQEQKPASVSSKTSPKQTITATVSDVSSTAAQNETKKRNEYLRQVQSSYDDNYTNALQEQQKKNENLQSLDTNDVIKLIDDNEINLNDIIYYVMNYTYAERVYKENIQY